MLAVSHYKVPGSYEEAVKSENSAEWTIAMKEEMEQLKRMEKDWKHMR